MSFSIEKKVIGAFVALISLTGCSPLGFFNAVVPYDQGSEQVAQDIAYGDDPQATGHREKSYQQLSFSMAAPGRPVKKITMNLPGVHWPPWGRLWW